MNQTVRLLLCSCVLLAGCKPALSPLQSRELAANLTAPYNYYINGMRTDRFDANGEHEFRLTASRVKHFAADDHAELTDPALLWSQDKGPSWTVTAKAGYLYRIENKDELTLVDEVKANTTLPQTGTMLIETNRLNVQPIAKTANTDAEVVITTPASRQSSTGMKLNLANNTMSLLKDVRGTYAP